jgi:hypothetical protein
MNDNDNEIVLNPTPTSVYKVSCYDAQNSLKWEDGFENLVTNVGKAGLLLSNFTSGTSPAWYVGLKDGGGSIAAGDTMASHGSWTELTPYSQANRPTWTPGSITTSTPSSVDNSGSVAVFSINATSTVVGCFLSNNNTLSGTSGLLYGGGDFGVARSVASGDTLNVTIQLQIS